MQAKVIGSPADLCSIRCSVWRYVKQQLYQRWSAECMLGTQTSLAFPEFPVSLPDFIRPELLWKKRATTVSPTVEQNNRFERNMEFP